MVGWTKDSRDRGAKERIDKYPHISQCYNEMWYRLNPYGLINHSIEIVAQMRRNFSHGPIIAIAIYGI